MIGDFCAVCASTTNQNAQFETIEQIPKKQALQPNEAEVQRKAVEVSLTLEMGGWLG